MQAQPSAAVRFGSKAADHCREDGLAKARTFDVLCFTHDVTFGRNGGFYVGRRTIGKRIRKKLRALGDELAKRSTAGGTAMIDDAGRHLRGHIQGDMGGGSPSCMLQYET